MSVDRLFRNGFVWTGRADAPLADTLLERDGVIVAVGGGDGRVPADEVVDLRGGTLLPAFGDGHAHPIFAGLESAGPAIAGLASVAEIVAEVGRYARARPKDDWIIGAGYDPTLAPNAAFDARWLDEAVTDRPVLLRASNYHTVWCNTAALRQAGITAASADPASGRIVRRADGSPLGTLLEWGACDLVLDLIPQRADADIVGAARFAGRTYAAAGVTWVQDAWVDPGAGMTEAYLAIAADEPAVRVSIALRADPVDWPAQRAVFRAERQTIRAAGVGDLVTARTVKFFADGIIESGTAALLDPYRDAPHSCGMLIWQPKALNDAVAAFDSDGYQVHVHAIGDAGVRAALDAIEHARRVNPPWDRRPVIAHVQLVHPDDVPRFAELGVIANFEPLWAQVDDAQTLLTLPRIDQRRGEHQYPMRAIADTGAPLSFGSDWPVSSPSPLAGIQVAVTRRAGDTPPLPGESLTVEQAFTAYTAGTAHQAFADPTRGTLTVGRTADLVHLARNPFTEPATAIGAIPVLGTWLAGRQTHQG